MIAVIEDRQMPPKPEQALGSETRLAVVAHLKAMLQRSLATQTFAATPIRRMNRFQYNNAVVDLLELDRGIFALPERLMRRYSDYFQPSGKKMPAEVQVASRPLGKDVDGARAEGFMGVGPFPQDRRAEHGYDNRADHLSLSPLLMESFLKLSHSIVESRDLNPKECRSWKSFFEKPPAAQNNEEAAVIRERLAKFLRRAFRRPVEPRDARSLCRVCRERTQSGNQFYRHDEGRRERDDCLARLSLLVQYERGVRKAYREACRAQAENRRF